MAEHTSNYAVGKAVHLEFFGWSVLRGRDMQIRIVYRQYLN